MLMPKNSEGSETVRTTDTVRALLVKSGVISK